MEKPEVEFQSATTMPGWTKMITCQKVCRGQNKTLKYLNSQHTFRKIRCQSHTDLLSMISCFVWPSGPIYCNWDSCWSLHGVRLAQHTSCTCISQFDICYVLDKTYSPLVHDAMTHLIQCDSCFLGKELYLFTHFCW